MKIVHTSDWHLGHTLHDVQRDYEHSKFLDWFLETLEEHSVDGLLICGDIFHSANPPARAQEMWYGFLARARKRLPDLDIVVVGGNHDSASRLDAPNPLLRAFSINVIGGARCIDNRLNTEQLVVPIYDKSKNIGAFVAAVPYVRSSDLPRVDHGDQFIDGMREAYRQVIDEAIKKSDGRAAVFAMGHLYMASTKLSEMSERRIFGGNLHAMPSDIFPPEVAYTALGHLHLAQQVGRENIRYSGSPLPLSMAEKTYPHQIVMVETTRTEVKSIKEIKVPRTVKFLRIPDKGALPLSELIPILVDLDVEIGIAGVPSPFLEVAVRLDSPQPTLRQEIEKGIEGKGYYLSKISTQYTGDKKTAADLKADNGLSGLKIEDVFERRWSRDHEDPLPPKLKESLGELLETVHQQERS